jgi:hypothetical protein
MVNILDLTAHSIEEYDQVRLFTELGHDVFSPGAYVDPTSPGDDMRPAIDSPLADHPELREVLDRVPATAEKPDKLWNAKDDLPDEWIEWADIIICHHVEWRWLWPQWDKLRASGKRIIWRTVGQSTHQNEHQAWKHVMDGCEVIRYSPKERNLPNYAGESGVIRFYKDPSEWEGWHGSGEFILLLAQNPRERAMWINLEWTLQATKDVPVKWVGPGTEEFGGLGKVTPLKLQSLMREARGMFYSGTQPASYTLALIEGMMTGLPVVSIDPSAMAMFPYSDRLYEGHTIAPLWAESPGEASEMLWELLRDYPYAQRVSTVSRLRAIALFGRDRIADAWDGWLSDKRVPDKDPEDLADVATWGLTEREMVQP